MRLTKVMGLLWLHWTFRHIHIHKHQYFIINQLMNITISLIQIGGILLWPQIKHRLWCLRIWLKMKRWHNILLHKNLLSQKELKSKERFFFIKTETEEREGEKKRFSGFSFWSFSFTRLLIYVKRIISQILTEKSTSNRYLPLTNSRTGVRIAPIKTVSTSHSEDAVTPTSTNALLYNLSSFNFSPQLRERESSSC